MASPNGVGASDRGADAESIARACGDAWRAFDADALDRAAALARVVQAELVPDSIAALRLQLGCAWHSLAAGPAMPDGEAAASEQQARKLAAPDLVLEAAALRTMAAAESGDLDHALECARRSFRMARTETLPESEFLAAVILARIRRCTGQPYLATRIATALRRFASAPWRPWIDWEITLAAGAVPEAASEPAVALARVLACAKAGDRDALEDAVTQLQQRTRGLAPLFADAQRVCTAIDPTRAPIDALAPWCAGLDPFAAPPFGLAGLDGHDDDEGGVALVLARGDRPGRRFLRLARELVASDGAAPIEGRVGRADGLLAALALAGPPGFPEAELFACVYGFAYAPALHRGAFDVALHRARARLDSLGTIERSDGTIRLVVHAPFVVADPRSLPATGERVLGRLARAGEIGAKELADALGMPLRTVQDSLRMLVEDGACTPKRAGRRVVYLVEDTTFQEPTNA